MTAKKVIKHIVRRLDSAIADSRKEVRNKWENAAQNDFLYFISCGIRGEDMPDNRKQLMAMKRENNR